jgi:hydroxyacylglutathione hydrolase
MSVRQFRYSQDNFGYLVFGSSTAVAVDGGAVGAMLDFIQTNRLVLKVVTNTHRHADHTSGNADLIRETKAEFIDNRDLSDGQIIDVEEVRVRVYQTPGHTDDSVCFHVENKLICGDTLFNGTVGNCFSGDLEVFYHSIKKLMALPGDTRIYAGHDYVKDSMRFARSLEPVNSAIDEFLKAYDPKHVVSTLAQELVTNPYLKFNHDLIVDLLRNRGLPVDTELARWKSLMSIE